MGVKEIDGLLADLGFASDQVDAADRGLSFQHDGPLDMRLDPTAGETAADLVARLNEYDLADGLLRVRRGAASAAASPGRSWRRGGRRRSAPTGQLADLVRRACRGRRAGRIDPATRVFQGLRIAVNDELGSLDRLLAQLPGS